MIFGLLGVNGAGKTTTFEMMSGMRTPSEGEVRLLGKDVMTDLEQCRNYIGYCPQFDCISPLLGVTDHLYLFGRIKGLIGADLEQAVEIKIKEMQLEKYRNRYAGTLSGGNKRKLSVAIALIGEPPIIFLDEPSTGMDPFARRFMWSVIDDVAERRKKSVVVLTTHSMEEGEALCSKIAIQVDGQFKCFGSVQQVKSTYGTGYEVAVKFKLVSGEQRLQALEHIRKSGFTQDLNDFLPRSFVDELTTCPDDKRERSKDRGGPFSHESAKVPFQVFMDWWILDDLVGALQDYLANVVSGQSVLVLEHHGLAARFRLPDLVDPAILPAMFDGLMSDGALHLDDFAVSQSTLEQIFNNFARKAADADSGKNGKPKWRCMPRPPCWHKSDTE